MIRTQAYLLDSEAVVFDLLEVEEVFNDIYADWVKFGCRGELALPTVKSGIFEGDIDKTTNAPVGQFTTNRGDVFQVFVDYAVQVPRLIPA